jgi:hypothetical protein
MPANSVPLMSALNDDDVVPNPCRDSCFRNQFRNSEFAQRAWASQSGRSKDLAAEE